MERELWRDRDYSMRKADKKQVEEFVQLLKRAHTEIKKTLEMKNQAAALDLLEQCQSCVIRLGEIIEQEEGEDFVTIPLLEEYCEFAYQIYEEVRQSPLVNGSKTYKLLNKALIRIENSIRNDIQVRTEVVFLPYKASMWDSLESIWKAADEDPDCDAYVIPIPYYDRNPDGSFREMHYEGDQYPKDVPVTDYNEYDFANRRPDMIFIHNPYDDCNFVTSVPPFFYSKNLKQFTDKLVYVPYFILSEVDPENEDAVKGMEHFCTAPGVIHADQVVVQSEEMRQVYIKALTRYAGKDTKKYWEDKILGIGSPKVDKVLNTRVEDMEIPEEWKKILEKPDGSRKKVILYNTSVGALLSYEEKMLKKMRSVLQTFYENHDEVALLWRPHPLIKATIESMRPQLWEDYKEIVETYREQGWGIYDDSAELDRALVMSDAYYGDNSSLVELCKSVEMPVMIQNVEIL